MNYLVINNESTTKEQYWSYCEKEHNPFIIVKNKGACYMEISYDVTNSSLDLEKISNDLKRFYKVYIEFTHIPYCEVAHYFDNLYFFSFLVRKQDLDFIASNLFDWLIFEFKNL